jgi:hypothetical protein
LNADNQWLSPVGKPLASKIAVLAYSASAFLQACQSMMAHISKLSLTESQPDKSEPTSDNKGYPAYRFRHRPVSDDDGPLRENSNQVEQRHDAED